MTQVILDYFRRFDNSITESLYSAITLEDYYKNKAAHEYLDYDKETIRRLGRQYTGIRNIDNSCYLSATLQILYNLPWLRERVFLVSGEASGFLRELQRLFAMMYKGSLVYVDPTPLFAVLRDLHPGVFVVGRQNDFHEVFVLVLEELEKSLNDADDRRFFRKMFYGRMKVQLTDDKGKIIGDNKNDIGNGFNIINLSSESGDFEQAIKNFKAELIEDYINEKGQPTKATKQISFLETPAVLTFFINRVTFKNNKLFKDCSQFDFSDKIEFNKTNITKSAKQSDIQKDKEVEKLKAWIKDIAEAKVQLQRSIEYFEKKQFADINVPTIENSLGPAAQAIAYLKQQIKEIETKTIKAEQDIAAINDKKIKQAEESFTQLYNIWAVMIHYGSTAESGHYKICIKVDEQANKWVEFNDRRTEQIPYEKIVQYKKKGQICCLFYRRSTMQNHSQRTQITSSLKKYVQEQQQRIIAKIDNARILQSLYQQFETTSLIWQYYNSSLTQADPVSSYFFMPILHLMLKKSPAQTCKGYLLYESICEQKFLENLRGRFIDEDKQVQVPKINFGLPQEYWSIAQALKEFLLQEVTNPIDAYENITFYLDVTLSDEITGKFFNTLKEIILLKGIFYESMLVHYNILPAYEIMAKNIDKIMQTLPTDSVCQLHLVPIRAEIHEIYLNKIIDNDTQASGTLKKQPLVTLINKQNGPRILRQRFGYWFQQRKHLNKLDAHILTQHAKLYPKYITPC